MQQIQWYPGHMTKARRAMQEDIKLVDMVIELVDARAPEASRNPDIDQMAQGKSRVLILNKADLADESVNLAWVCYDAGFQIQGKRQEGICPDRGGRQGKAGERPQKGYPQQAYPGYGRRYS